VGGKKKPLAIDNGVAVEYGMFLTNSNIAYY
jgi:hypothetical protein